MKQVREDTGIVHFRVQESASLLEFLLSADLTPLAIRPTRDWVDECLHYGCVYVDGLRRRENFELREGQVLRLHTRRKNYATDVAELSSRVVLDEDEFLVLDKPAGLPTHPTLDNYVDNAQFRLSEERGAPVLVTHRLDIATQGLLILAKNKGAQAALNKAFAKGRVEKIYRALTATGVAPGAHAHFMDPQSRVPRRVSESEEPGWWPCRLEVLESLPHAMGRLSEIRLLTGKTHQIRAQFAALGAPILGDATYGSADAYRTPHGIALECYRMRFPFRSREFEVRRPRSLKDERW